MPDPFHPRASPWRAIPGPVRPTYPYVQPDRSLDGIFVYGFSHRRECHAPGKPKALVRSRGVAPPIPFRASMRSALLAALPLRRKRYEPWGREPS